MSEIFSVEYERYGLHYCSVDLFCKIVFVMRRKYCAKNKLCTSQWHLLFNAWVYCMAIYTGCLYSDLLLSVYGLGHDCMQFEIAVADGEFVQYYWHNNLSFFLNGRALYSKIQDACPVASFVVRHSTPTVSQGGGANLTMYVDLCRTGWPFHCSLETALTETRRARAILLPSRAEREFIRR